MIPDVLFPRYRPRDNDPKRASRVDKRLGESNFLLGKKTQELLRSRSRVCVSIDGIGAARCIPCVIYEGDIEIDIPMAASRISVLGVISIRVADDERYTSALVSFLLITARTHAPMRARPHTHTHTRAIDETPIRD